MRDKVLRRVLSQTPGKPLCSQVQVVWQNPFSLLVSSAILFSVNGLKFTGFSLVSFNVVLFSLNVVSTTFYFLIMWSQKTR